MRKEAVRKEEGEVPSIGEGHKLSAWPAVLLSVPRSWPPTRKKCGKRLT
jgi:hypothetical protein